MTLQNKRAKPPAKNGHVDISQMPDDGREELTGDWAYLFGDKIRLPMISDIPSHMILAFCCMRLQSAACELTGGIDDANLTEEFEGWFEELMIGRNRMGRSEGVAIARAQRQDDSEDEEASLWGKLRK